MVDDETLEHGPPKGIDTALVEGVDLMGEPDRLSGHGPFRSTPTTRILAPLVTADSAVRPLR